MKTEINKRSSNDIEWKNVCDIVDKRDKKSCQFLNCLSAQEYHKIKGPLITIKDRAHIFSVSSHPELIYNPKNIITLQRTFHQRMDEYCSPLDNSNIDINMHYWWWLRIFSKQYSKYDPSIDYEYILLCAIK